MKVPVAFYAPMKPPTHPTPSGDRRMAKLLIRAWQGAGHGVELASRFRSYDRGDGDRQARLKAVGHRLAGRLIARYRARPPERRPGLWFTYHLYHKAPDWLGPAVSAALDIPYVVAEASYAPKQRGGPWDLGHKATAQALGVADLVMGFNRTDGACVAPLLKSPGCQIFVPPFIDTTPFVQAMEQRHFHRQQLSKRYGLPSDIPWLLCVAMMRPDQKLLSYQHLGTALAKILDRPWQLIVVGSGGAEDAVRQALGALGTLGNRVTWLGGLTEDDLRPVYAGADIFVWPAIKEAYGMVFLEALSTGLPVIAGRTPGVAGIVSHDMNGILVDVDSATAFADGVARLVGDGDLRAKLSHHAHMDMVAGHDLRAMSDILGGHALSLTTKGAP